MERATFHVYNREVLSLPQRRRRATLVFSFTAPNRSCAPLEFFFSPKNKKCFCSPCNCKYGREPPPLMNNHDYCLCFTTQIKSPGRSGANFFFLGGRGGLLERPPPGAPRLSNYRNPGVSILLRPWRVFVDQESLYYYSPGGFIEYNAPVGPPKEVFSRKRFSFNPHTQRVAPHECFSPPRSFSF